MKSLNKTKRVLLVTISTLGLMLSSLNMTNAAEGFPDCNELGQPEKTKGFIITILEERINPVTDPKDQSKNQKGVINCFRKTTCSKENGCKSEYVKECKPDGTSGEGTICQPIQVILAKSGADIIYTYVGTIYRWAAGTIGIVTVLYLVFGGIEIATAGADSGKMDKAKERIKQSIAGLVLLFLSALILYTINPNFFVV